ncbi:hypothetical protein J4454_03620 [Candidatus Pacearchaeota archaeon]|nr:hypothetical protein [Candidatus Pacearchaeota archaeon]HIH17767.1 hypothetical protein [Nanoarchaeota archaeon]
MEDRSDGYTLETQTGGSGIPPTGINHTAIAADDSKGIYYIAGKESAGKRRIITIEYGLPMSSCVVKYDVKRKFIIEAITEGFLWNRETIVNIYPTAKGFDSIAGMNPGEFDSLWKRKEGDVVNELEEILIGN